MRVLFLALGANRRAAVTKESRELAEAGGHPVVLVDQPSAWAEERFAPGVEIVSLAALIRGRRPAFVDKVTLLRRVAGRLQRRRPDRPYDVLLRRHGRFDAIVVADALSFPAAERLTARLGGTPRVAYRLDQLPGPAAALVTKENPA
jgi:hypothetical protein